MKTMLAIMVVAILFSSCKKYLASEEPDSRFPEKYVFSSVPTTKSAVMGVYQVLALVFNGSNIPFRFPLDTDEGMFNNGTPGVSDNSITDITKYNVSPTNIQLPILYDQLYVGIERANNCIKNIPSSDLYKNGSATQKAELERLLGEALTLRALFYFELIKVWGDVPAPFVPSIDQENIALPRTDRQEIYDQVLKDLELSATLVPWRGDGVASVIDERITKGAVKGLRARLALHAGGYSLRKGGKMERTAEYLKYYEICKKECLDIMQNRQKHTLNPSFQAVFKDNILKYKIEQYGEVMFEAGMGIEAQEGNLGFMDGPKIIPIGFTAIRGNGVIRILPSYFYAFDPLDTRRDVTIAPYQIDLNTMIVTPNAVWANGKFRLDWLNPLPSSQAIRWGINQPILRYSDVLLMFAEADNELNNGPTAEAKSAFEEVRRRAFKGSESQIGITPSSKEAFFTAIVNERFLEFGCEGIRKYDLIRWNMLWTKIQETRSILTKMKDKIAPYDNLPQTMRYKTGATSLIWGNSFYEKTPTTPVPAGYASFTWINAIVPLYIQRVAMEFKPNHSEILPLPMTAINSNPNLSNTEYGY
ncbi:RagB/SusD family nutrient uptake outer membrane protein [Pedobacter africanus]|uniref:Uncharacterized protein n=1 Tax=Pedobacter africanus TaxID=151894 RepID=A0ACC6KS17_9SPHI|nr:RagB/SusD family nutrient uptake outer membrane protein [Pedobacter africanus]MDR6781982.1 hypothetical protein [Pedobacter africanus]